MLGRMRRRYTREYYLTLVEALREARPDIALSTDIIVGFPGETEAEHQSTLSLLEEVRYDFIYSFNYSPRPHTPASRDLPDDVPLEVKKRRLHEVQGLQAEITHECMQVWEGKVLPVLVEGPSKRDPTWRSGRISQNWIVNFEADDGLQARVVNVRIDRALSNCLLGTRVPPGGADRHGAALRVLN